MDYHQLRFLFFRGLGFSVKVGNNVKTNKLFFELVLGFGLETGASYDPLDNGPADRLGDGCNSGLGVGTDFQLGATYGPIGGEFVAGYEQNVNGSRESRVEPKFQPATNPLDSGKYSGSVGGHAGIKVVGWGIK
ncbi:MAG: hypothetical protein JKY55_16995 [Aliivibrio sp.]|uniref:hypothetical protein n=1 Tax=Aliivibrio sp. TaxID=1872443 RepID=UPI001A512552|nr:hypothetical protein [Aliivibrio sp.]